MVVFAATVLSKKWSKLDDPVHLLMHHGIGMTDLVKRATTKAAELRPEEYRDGLARLGGSPGSSENERSYY